MRPNALGVSIRISTLFERPVVQVGKRSQPARRWQATVRDVGRQPIPLPQSAVANTSTDLRTTNPWTPHAFKAPIDPVSPVTQTTCTIRLDNEDIEFDPIFLRDSCSCSACVDPSSRQKQFETVDIPANIKVKHVDYDDHAVNIRWGSDVPGTGAAHITRLPYSFLRTAVSEQSGYADNDVPQKVWNREEIERDLCVVDYQEYTTKADALHSALLALKRHGLVFLKNVPESETSVVTIANRIGPLKNTFYGSTWDVRSVPNAKNVAYTHQHLGFHMDLLYMQQPPRLQFLHCLRASTSGGASLFTDSYRAIQRLSETDADAFKDLCTYRTNFHYSNDGHHYHQSRPIIQLRQGPDRPTTALREVIPFVEAVNWSPPFQGPFTGAGNQYALGSHMRHWHYAAGKFRDLVEAKDAIYQRQMAPGECVIFDNRRVLHARTAFEVGDVGKERWLKGAYLDWDPYASKLKELNRQMKKS